MDFPPHVCDETPLTSSPSLTAGAIAGRFRYRAGQFRQAVGLDRLDLQTFTTLSDLQRACGRDLMDARERGFIPDSHAELRDLIEWHRTPDPPFDGSPQYARGPLNLFIDVCGGHLSRFNAPLGEVTGGLMPRYAGHEHLNLPELERCARTCEYVASLIESTASTPGSHEEQAMPLTAADLPALGAAIRDLQHIIEHEEETPTGRTICEWEHRQTTLGNPSSPTFTPLDQPSSHGLRLRAGITWVMHHLHPRADAPHPDKPAFNTNLDRNETITDSPDLTPDQKRRLRLLRRDLIAHPGMDELAERLADALAALTPQQQERTSALKTGDWCSVFGVESKHTALKNLRELRDRGQACECAGNRWAVARDALSPGEWKLATELAEKRQVAVRSRREKRSTGTHPKHGSPPPNHV